MEKAGVASPRAAVTVPASDVALEVGMYLYIDASFVASAGTWIPIHQQ